MLSVVMCDSIQYVSAVIVLKHYSEQSNVNADGRGNWEGVSYVPAHSTGQLH